MRTPGWLLLSGAAHGALALVKLDPPAVEPRPVVEARPVELEFAVTSVEPTPAVEPAEAVPVAMPSRQAAPRAPKRVAPTVLMQEEEPVPAPTEERQHPVISLSPRAAALSAISLDDGDVQVDAGVQARGPLRDGQTRALEASLMEAVRKVDTKHEPVLHPKAGGGYEFNGNGFDATINPDGSVQMADNFTHSNFTFPIPFVGKKESDVSGFWFFQSKFQLFEWLDRKVFKNDPFQSERRWFMDSTRAMREDMAAHFHDKRVHSHSEQ